MCLSIQRRIKVATPINIAVVVKVIWTVVLLLATFAGTQSGSRE